MPNLLKTLHLKSQRFHQLLLGDRTAKQLSHFTDYFSPQPIAGYIGFLGHQNLGDEILWESFRLLFREFQFLTYDGATHPVDNPPFNDYPLELALYRALIKPRHFYNVVFLGGGTLINRAQYLHRFQHALRQSDRCVVFGTGVCEPNFWQEREPREDYFNLMQRWVPVLADAAMIKVRGPLSASILAAHGLARPEFISDPALSRCQPRPLPFPRTGTIGINVGSHGILWGSQQQVYDGVKQLVRQLLRMGWAVELLPFQGSDLKLSDRLVQELGSPAVSIWRNFAQIDRVLERIQTCDLIIGQRLHSIVLACGCGVPFIGLNYAPKCDDFLESIEFQKFSVRTDAIDVDAILALVLHIDRNYDSHCQRLVEIGNHYRLLQCQVAQDVVNQVLQKT